MSLLNQIPEYIRDKNNNLKVKAPEVYIDDIFDPLFNANARDYLENKYGLGWLGNTLAGYAEGVDNAILGQTDKWGAFGPGMGILSGFGRSMDKAGDFIIGTATEAINAAGHVLGSQVPIENPLHNIFVEDQDYSGQRLLAAMANSMSALAGGNTVNEDSFNGLWNIPAIGLELATDPGILGGSLTKHYSPDIYRTYKKTGNYSSKDILKNIGNAGVKSAVGEIGQLLSNYDDLMAKVSLDVTAPGVRHILKSIVDKLHPLLAANKTKNYEDIIYGKYAASNNDFSETLPDGLQKTSAEDYLYQMADEITHIAQVNPDIYPETYAKLMDIQNNKNFKSMSLAQVKKYAEKLKKEESLLNEFTSNLQTKDADTLNELYHLLDTEDLSALKSLESPNTINEEVNMFEKILTADTPEAEDLRKFILDSEGKSFDKIMESEGLIPGVDFDPRGLESKIISLDNFRKQYLTRHVPTGNVYKVYDSLLKNNFESPSFTDDLTQAFEKSISDEQLKNYDVFKKHIVKDTAVKDFPKERQTSYDPAWDKLLWEEKHNPEFIIHEDYVEHRYPITPSLNDVDSYGRRISYSDVVHLPYVSVDPSFLDKTTSLKTSDVDFKELGKALDSNTYMYSTDPEGLENFAFDLKALIRRRLGEGYSSYNTPILLGVSHYNRKKALIAPAVESFLSKFERMMTNHVKAGFLDLTPNSTGDELWKAISRSLGTSSDEMRKVLHYEKLPEEYTYAPPPLAKQGTFVNVNEYRPLVQQDPKVKSKLNFISAIEDNIENIKAKYTEKIENIDLEINKALTSRMKHQKALELTYQQPSNMKDIYQANHKKGLDNANNFIVRALRRKKHYEQQLIKELEIPNKGLEQAKKELTTLENKALKRIIQEHSPAPKKSKVSQSPVIPSTIEGDINHTTDLINREIDTTNANIKKSGRTYLEGWTNEGWSIKSYNPETDTYELSKTVLKPNKNGKGMKSETFHKTLKHYEKSILDEYRQKGMEFQDLKKVQEKSIELGDEGNRYIPGLDVLLNLKTKTLKDSDNALDIAYDAIQDFVNFTQRIKYYYPDALKSNQIKELVELGESWIKNIEFPLKSKELSESPSGSIFTNYNKIPTDTFNTLLAKHPETFTRPDGTIDVQKFKRVRQMSENITVFPNSRYKDIIVPLEESNYGFSIKEALNLKDFISKEFKTTVPFSSKNSFFKVYNHPKIKELLEVNPNLKGVISYLFHPNVDVKTFNIRLKRLQTGQIPLEDLPRLFPGNFRQQPYNFNADIGDTLQETFQEMNVKKPAPYANIESKAEKLFSELPESTYVEVVNFPKSTTEYMYDSFESEWFSKYDGLGPGSISENIRKFGTVKDKHLFDVLQAAKAVKTRNETGDVASLRTKRVENSLHKAQVLNIKYDKKAVTDFLDDEYLSKDDIVKGKNYLTSLASSDGYALYNVQANSAEYNRIKKVLGYNNKVLQASEFLKITETPLKNGRVIIALSLNLKNPKLYKQFVKALDNTKGLQDLVLYQAKHTRVKAPIINTELENFFKENDEFNTYMHNSLGRTEYDVNSSRRVYLQTDENDKLMADIYKKLDLNISGLQNAARDLRGFIDDKGTFGTLTYSSPFKGKFSNWVIQDKNILDTNLENIVKHNYTSGVYDNINTQSYIDVFVNDNFKIHAYMNSVDDLKRTINVTDETGSLTGNMYNLTLCSPKYDKNGKIIGFKQYDKFSDTQLQEAFDNAETVLLPTDTIAHLDSLCKKDRKMSNKIYCFINKHLILPFKLGVLANPGFLISNVSDAYMKQAVNMANAYGTSVTEELANVARSMRTVTILKNKFEDVFQKYAQHLQKVDKNINILYLNSQSISTMPKAKQRFVDFLNMPKNGLTTKEQAIANLYLEIDSIQSTAIFESEVAEAFVDETLNTRSKFQDPTPLGERVLTGSSQYNPKDVTTWGLFANNPIIKKLMKTNSQAEIFFRTTAILNDLTHKGYDLDTMCKILEVGADNEKVLLQQFEIDLLNAQNAMNASNFNYEYSSNLLNAASHIIPFPTFFLKNFSFWMDLIIENPQMIDHLLTVQEGLWAGQDDEEDEFKAEAKGRGAIPISNSNSGQGLSKFFKGIYKPSPLNSMFSAFNLLNAPLDNLQYRLNPAIRLTTSPFMDSEDVKYRPYTTNQYERNIKKDDPKFNALEYMFHTLNPYERAVSTHLRTPGKFAKGEAQLSDVLPSVFQPDF